MEATTFSAMIDEVQRILMNELDKASNFLAETNAKYKPLYLDTMP